MTEKTNRMEMKVGVFVVGELNFNDNIEHLRGFLLHF